MWLSQENYEWRKKEKITKDIHNNAKPRLHIICGHKNG